MKIKLIYIVITVIILILVVLFFVKKRTSNGPSVFNKCEHSNKSSAINSIIATIKTGNTKMLAGSSMYNYLTSVSKLEILSLSELCELDKLLKYGRNLTPTDSNRIYTLYQKTYIN